MKINTLKLNSDAPVSVIIGENGCGKSQILSSLASISMHERECVIAIATSIYDKFPRRNSSSKYHYIGGRLGRNLPREAIKSSIINTSKNNEENFNFIFRVLDYVKFDQRIGFKVSGLNASSINDLHYNDFEIISSELQFKLEMILKYLLDIYNVDRERIIWFGPKSSYIETFDEFLFDLLKYEKELKKRKIISSIDVFISKGRSDFPLNLASSGELSLISTLIFISGVINGFEPLILIDEPENSLHPRWQREYITNIINLFYFYSPQIVVATHSAMIVSGLQSEAGIEIHKYTKSGFVRMTLDTKNTEDLFDDLFDVITPENRSLSEKCAVILNDVNVGALSYEKALAELQGFINRSYDEKQKDFLNSVIELLVKVKEKIL